MKSIVGEKFGMWTVLYYDKIKKSYNCLCSCGNISFVQIGHLKAGNSKSCGCLSGKKTAERISKDGYTAQYNHFYNQYKISAAKRGYSFELSKEEFTNLINSNCFYCGLTPTNKGVDKKLKFKNTIDFKWNGIDRKNNSIGYISSNCTTCCKFCNMFKSTMDADEWLSHVKRIATHQKLI